MNQFDMCDITQHCYHDGIVTRLNAYCFQGVFPEEESDATGLAAFCIYFQFEKVPDIFNHLPDVTDAAILSFEVMPCQQGYDVKLCILAEEFHAIIFQCTNLHCELYRYMGMSYRNIYDEIDFSDMLCYLTDEFYQDEEQISVADDLIILHKEYCYQKYDDKGRLIAANNFGKYQVLKNGREIYSFLNDDDQVSLRNPLVLHSNGRRYLAFHVGLYGISYLDPDSGQVYHYVPEGYTHDVRSSHGESFIITEIYYDKNSDLIAYGGCYWAAPSEIFVGDFRNPLHYNPHLIRIHELLDPEWEKIDDIDFVRWDADALIVNCDGKEVSLSVSLLRKALKKEA